MTEQNTTIIDINNNQLLNEKFLFRKYIEKIMSNCALTPAKLCLIMQDISNYILMLPNLKKIFSRIGFMAIYACDEYGNKKELLWTRIAGVKRTALETIDFLRRTVIIRTGETAYEVL